MKDVEVRPYAEQQVNVSQILASKGMTIATGRSKTKRRNWLMRSHFEIFHHLQKAQGGLYALLSPTP